MELKLRTAPIYPRAIFLSPKEAMTQLQKMLILDVQNPRYVTSTLPKARQLNVDIFLKEIPTAQPILLTCLDGNRAPTAAQQLLRRGYLFVYVLKGGVIGWRQAGYTVQGIHRPVSNSPRLLRG